jgi:hypothetical protein
MCHTGPVDVGVACDQLARCDSPGGPLQPRPCERRVRSEPLLSQEEAWNLTAQHENAVPRFAFDKLREGAASMPKTQAQAENPGYGIQAVGNSARATTAPRAPTQFDTVKRRGGGVSVLGSITVNTPSR